MKRETLINLGMVLAIGLSAAALLVAVSGAGETPQALGFQCAAGAVCFEDSAATARWPSGATLKVQSGAKVDIQSGASFFLQSATITASLDLAGSLIKEIGVGTATNPAQGSTAVAHGMGVTPDACVLTSVGADITRTLAYTTTGTTSFWIIAGAGTASNVSWICVDE